MLTPRLVTAHDRFSLSAILFLAPEWVMGSHQPTKHDAWYRGGY